MRTTSGGRQRRRHGREAADVREQHRHLLRVGRPRPSRLALQSARPPPARSSARAALALALLVGDVADQRADARDQVPAAAAAQPSTIADAAQAPRPMPARRCSRTSATVGDGRDDHDLADARATARPAAPAARRCPSVNPATPPGDGDTGSDTHCARTPSARRRARRRRRPTRRRARSGVPRCAGRARTRSRPTGSGSSRASRDCPAA